jgi:hypothetical protein
MKCTNPFNIKVNEKIKELPCNRCLACRINRTSEWTLRLLAEIPNYNGKALFVTYTYNELNVPVAHYRTKNSTSIIRETLQYEDMTKYWKRLRKKLEKTEKNIKYLYVGEYGEQTNRPHYHAIILGLTKKQDEENIINCWGLGNVNIGSATNASIRYTCSYIIEKKDPKEYLPAEPPKMHCSKNLGKKIILQDLERIIENGYIRAYNGKRISIPKFIKDMYKDEFERIANEKEIEYYKKNNIDHKYNKKHIEIIHYVEKENIQRNLNLEAQDKRKQNKKL